MPRSKRPRQGSFGRQNTPQSSGRRGGGFEQTGMDRQGQQGQFASREGYGGGDQERWSNQRGNWGQEGWREPSERSDYSEGREYGYGRGGYEGPRGMGSQDWSRRTGSSAGYTRVGWGPSDEGERGSWEDNESRYDRRSEQAGYDDEEYRGMESSYGGSEPGEYSFQEPGRFAARGLMGPSRSGQQWGQGSQWGRGSQLRRGTNQGSFAGRGPQGYKRSDERIMEDINEALTQDHDVDASNITVEVQGGEITLKGTVTDRAAKRRAEDIAESCSGVKQVQNQLRIKREEESDSESRRDKSEKSEDKRSHRQQIAS